MGRSSKWITTVLTEMSTHWTNQNVCGVSKFSTLKINKIGTNFGSFHQVLCRVRDGANNALSGSTNGVVTAEKNSHFVWGALFRNP